MAYVLVEPTSNVPDTDDGLTIRQVHVVIEDTRVLLRRDPRRNGVEYRGGVVAGRHASALGALSRCDREAVRQQPVDAGDPLQALLDGVLESAQPVRARYVVRLERAEAGRREHRLHEPVEARPGEVLVPEHLRHVREENRVVAVGLDDQRRPARPEDAAVLGQRGLRMLHVVQRVLRVDEVELAVLERETLSVRDGERDPGHGLPPFGGLDVDRNDLADTLAQQPGDPAVAAAGVEQALVALEREAELLDAAQAVTELTVAPRYGGGHGGQC